MALPFILRLFNVVQVLFFKILLTQSHHILKPHFHHRTLRNIVPLDKFKMVERKDSKNMGNISGIYILQNLQIM